MPEFRNILAAVGTALTALGVGLVILAKPALESVDNRLEYLGWTLVAIGLCLLLLSLVGVLYGGPPFSWTRRG